MAKYVHYYNVPGYTYTIDEKGIVEDTLTNTQVNYSTDSKGYTYVYLRREDDSTKNQKILLHRLVADTYINLTGSTMEKNLRYNRNSVRFRDGDKNNANPRNLQWVSNSELKLINKIKNENPITKFDYLEYIYQLLRSGYDYDDILYVLDIYGNWGFWKKRKFKTYIKRVKG